MTQIGLTASLEKSPMTPEQAAASTAMAALAIRQARGERISQSAIANAVRQAADADLDAQHPKKWAATR